MKQIDEKINLICKFRHNEKVQITKGYYRNYKGIVKDVYKSFESIFYSLELDIDDKKLYVDISETSLKKCLF